MLLHHRYHFRIAIALYLSFRAVLSFAARCNDGETAYDCQQRLGLSSGAELYAAPPNNSRKTLKESAGDDSVFITPDSAVSIMFPKVGPVTNSVTPLKISNNDGTNIHPSPPVTQYTWQTETKGNSLYTLMEIKNLSKPRLAVNQPKFLIYNRFFAQGRWINMGPDNVNWNVKTIRGHKVETLDGTAKNGSPLRCDLSSFGGGTLVVAACVLSGSDHPSVKSQQEFLDSMTFSDDTDDDEMYRSR